MSGFKQKVFQLVEFILVQMKMIQKFYIMLQLMVMYTAMIPEIILEEIILYLFTKLQIWIMEMQVYEKLYTILKQV